MFGARSQWTKWWIGGERGREEQAVEELFEHPRTPPLPVTVALSERPHQSGRRGRRGSSVSLHNNPASPTGSRASSIAGDRTLLGRHVEAPSHDLIAAGREFSITNETPPWRRSFASAWEPWATRALERPFAEPPILDYRKFEENGRMYDSVHRHPETKPEDWYEYTDAEIEVELLGDYHGWIRDAKLEAVGAYNASRVAFYNKLSKEVDIDRMEPHDDLLNIKERMYTKRHARMSEKRVAGKRVQDQFDQVRKTWREVDSSSSEWDEREWEIFGGRRARKKEERVLNEENLQEMSGFSSAPQQRLW